MLVLIGAINQSSIVPDIIWPLTRLDFLFHSRPKRKAGKQRVLGLRLRPLRGAINVFDLSTFVVFSWHARLESYTEK